MSAADPTPLVEHLYYHYPLEKHNRDRVKAQATRLNESLERLRKTSQSFEAPVGAPHNSEPPCRETCVTIPEEKTANLNLRKALEEAEDACSKSSPPPAKKKRWFGWAD